MDYASIVNEELFFDVDHLRKFPGEKSEAIYIATRFLKIYDILNGIPEDKQKDFALWYWDLTGDDRFLREFNIFIRSSGIPDLGLIDWIYRMGWLQGTLIKFNLKK